MARAAVGTGRRPATVIGVLASCGVVVSQLPAFPTLLDTAPGNVAWLVTATLLSGAVCAPVLGRLGDMYGLRRMLLVALWPGRCRHRVGSHPAGHQHHA